MDFNFTGFALTALIFYVMGVCAGHNENNFRE